MSRATWPTRPIGDLFHISAGKTMSAKAREGLQRTPFLRTSNVFWDEIDLSNIDEMSISDDELVSKSLQKGDLLVCEGGDIGRAAVWMGEREVMSFQNHLHRLRPKTNLTCSGFYVYFLQCGFTQLGIYEGAGNKTTIPNLSRNRLAVLEVPLPSLNEQQAITSLLAMVRKGLNAHMKAEKLAQELKAACMQQLFTRGLRGEAQKETEIGPIPENWTIHKMSSVCEFLPGFAFKSNDYTAEGVRLFKISNVSFGTTSWAETSFLPCEYLKINKKYVLQPNDIVLAMTRPIVQGGIKVTRIDRSDLPALLNQRVCKIIPSKVQSIYLYQLLFSSYFVNGIDGGAGGSQQPNISTEKIGSIWLPFPQSTDEQNEIGKILDAIDQKIALHKQKKSVLDELFRSLLHKLMTGEISVEDLDLSALTSEEPQPKTEAEAPS